MAIDVDAPSAAHRDDGEGAAARTQGAWSALMLHGAGGGAWEWDVWRGVFEAARIEVHATELQASPRGIAATGLDDYRAQVASAWRTLRSPRVAIGASLGGQLAMELASTADAIVLVNPVPPSPWHAQLPHREWAPVVPWRRDARLAGTRRALADADDATALQAFRRWRDESGAVLREAHAGVVVAIPAIPVLCIVSGRDEDIPSSATQALASAWQADVLRLPESSHAGPLLGRDAASVAANVVAWLSRR